LENKNEFKLRQERHGGVRKDYAAPTGLENFVGGSSTKISLLTELVAVCQDPQPRCGWNFFADADPV